MNKLLLAGIPACLAALMDIMAAWQLGMAPFPRFAPVFDGLLAFLVTVLLLKIQRPLWLAVVISSAEPE